VQVDIQATAAVYRAFVPHKCDCAYCRNLRLQWSAFLTAPLRELLTSVGIDPDKPIEIVEFGRHENGGRIYSVEWAFLAAPATNARPPATFYDTDGSEFLVQTGGIPEPSFDSLGNRRSIRITRHNVPWIDPEKEPD
jgi:hypothetical protein